MNKNAKIVTAIIIINLLLVLFFFIGTGFNFGIVLAIAAIFTYRNAYQKDKLVTLKSLTGLGALLTLVTFFTLVIFTDTTQSKNQIQEKTQDDAYLSQINDKQNKEVDLEPVDSVFKAINKEYVANDYDVIWTANGMSLKLNDGKKALFESSQDLDKYFLDNGWTTQSIGFTYVAKDGTDSIGYMYPSMTGDLKGMMCIVYRDSYQVACGFGPNGN